MHTNTLPPTPDGVPPRPARTLPPKVPRLAGLSASGSPNLTAGSTTTTIDPFDNGTHAEQGAQEAAGGEVGAGGGLDEAEEAGEAAGPERALMPAGAASGAITAGSSASVDKGKRRRSAASDDHELTHKRSNIGRSASGVGSPEGELTPDLSSPGPASSTDGIGPPSASSSSSHSALPSTITPPTYVPNSSSSDLLHADDDKSTSGSSALAAPSPPPTDSPSPGPASPGSSHTQGSDESSDDGDDNNAPGGAANTTGHSRAIKLDDDQVSTTVPSSPADSTSTSSSSETSECSLSSGDQSAILDLHDHFDPEMAARSAATRQAGRELVARRRNIRRQIVAWRAEHAGAEPPQELSRLVREAAREAVDWQFGPLEDDESDDDGDTVRGAMTEEERDDGMNSGDEMTEGEDQNPDQPDADAPSADNEEDEHEASDEGSDESEGEMEEVLLGESPVVDGEEDKAAEPELEASQSSA